MSELGKAISELPRQHSEASQIRVFPSTAPVRVRIEWSGFYLHFDADENCRKRIMEFAFQESVKQAKELYSGPPISTSPLETEGSEVNKIIASADGPDAKLPHKPKPSASENPKAV